MLNQNFKIRNSRNSSFSATIVVGEYQELVKKLSVIQYITSGLNEVQMDEHVTALYVCERKMGLEMGFVFSSIPAPNS